MGGDDWDAAIVAWLKQNFLDPAGEWNPDWWKKQ